MDYNKVPPYDIRAEKSVLGGMILEKDVIIDVVQLLKSDDFYKGTHQEIFSAIITLFDKSIPVDLVTLNNELSKKGILESIGGIEYLNDLTNVGILTSNAHHYAEIVKEKSVLRKLINASLEISESAYSSETSDVVLERAEKLIFDISQNKSSDDISHIRDVLMDTYSQIERVSKSDGSITGLPTGFYDLDLKTSGFQNSDLILLAARPSMGKTAIGLNLCQNIAKSTEKSVMIFSLEMSKAQLVQRMLSSESNVGLSKIRNGNLSSDDWEKLANATAPISKSNIYIDDTPAITVMEMRAKCRRLKMEKGLGLVLVDYLQLMSSGGKSESRQQEISNISRGLKGLARELDCPVIALSQLSRAPELRTDHRPILSDLRESGAIEQDADIVMFLYRDEYYNSDSEKKGVGELIIAKQRNGETGTIELAWFGDIVKYVSLESEIG